MLNEAAYSYTHHLIWSHLRIVKPQSLQVTQDEMTDLLIFKKKLKVT